MSKTLSISFLMRVATLVLLTGLALAAGRALAQPGAANAPAGPAYTELSMPLPVDSTTKIEVVEFFWYGCPHCYALEPQIESWLATLPKDVEFKRIPAPANEVWKAASRTFYALEALGLQPKLHKTLFDSVQNDRLRLTNTQQVDDWLSRQGVDVARFHAAENSFSVESKLKRAEQLFDMSQADGVPIMVVQGRYTVEMAKVGTPEKMIETVNALIEQVRKNPVPAVKAPASTKATPPATKAPTAPAKPGPGKPTTTK